MERAVKNLSSSEVVVACVIDFHEGTAPTAAKVAQVLPFPFLLLSSSHFPSPHQTNSSLSETTSAVAAGAKELDLVIPYTLLHTSSSPESTSYPSLYHTISAVRSAAPSPIILKTIFETSQLSVKEIVAASLIAKEAGVDFVKTSTGFNGRGASIEDVRVMKTIVGDEIGVKASGGVRSAEDLVKMVEAGATRVGTSGGVGIMEGAKGGGGGY